jgi:hypothetical protein
VSVFQQPAIASPEDKFVFAENLGALLLFFPTELKVKVPTQHGESDAISARVVRLNDGRVYENALIFPVALVTQLKQAVPDGMVLGTLTQGANTKGNPPWLLSPHEAADVAQAEAWLAANPRQQFAQPAAQAAPPTTPAWGQQATPAAPAWGQQPPAPAPAAPATGGWGQAPAAAPAGPAAWQNAGAPAAPPAPVQQATGVDPGLLAALQAKGYNLPPGTTQQAAEGIWAMVSAQ